MKSHIIVFVEGDTDEVVFKEIVRYYQQQFPVCKDVKCTIDNLKGVGKYASKACGKLKNKYLPQADKAGENISAILCSYDTDVFEFASNPPVNWMIVKRNINALLHKEIAKQIPVKSSIEDWLLSDIDGLCCYLNIKKKPKLNGQSAFDKISTLFKMKNKIYTKGYECDKIIQHINIETIIQCHNKDLIPLKKALGIK